MSSENFLIGNGIRRIYGTYNDVDKDDNFFVATSGAVKKAYDKAVEALNKSTQNSENIENLNSIITEIEQELTSLVFKTGDFKISMRGTGGGQNEGFLLCNGAQVSRTTYADLFAVIGTKFGEGDGSTTFNLPDFRGRFIQGANNDLGSVKEAGLPNITGGGLQFGSVRNNPYMYGALFNNSYNNVRGAGYNDACGVDFDASRSNSIYGASDTVQPPAIVLNVFIKY